MAMYIPAQQNQTDWGRLGLDMASTMTQLAIAKQRAENENTLAQLMAQQQQLTNKKLDMEVQNIPTLYKQQQQMFEANLAGQQAQTEAAKSNTLYNQMRIGRLPQEWQATDAQNQAQLAMMEAQRRGLVSGVELAQKKDAREELITRSELEKNDQLAYFAGEQMRMQGQQTQAQIGLLDQQTKSIASGLTKQTDELHQRILEVATKNRSVAMGAVNDLLNANPNDERLQNLRELVTNMPADVTTEDVANYAAMARVAKEMDQVRQNYVLLKQQVPGEVENLSKLSSAMSKALQDRLTRRTAPNTTNGNGPVYAAEDTSKPTAMPSPLTTRKLKELHDESYTGFGTPNWPWYLANKNIVKQDSDTGLWAVKLSDGPNGAGWYPLPTEWQKTFQAMEADKQSQTWKR